MKCQKCQKNEAVVHFTEIINGTKTETYLCKSCSDLNAGFSFSSPFDLDFGSFFQSVIGGEENFSNHLKAPLVCKVCKSTLKDIQTSGRLGCSECYNTFRNELIRPLKEIHGSSQHVGKIPKRIGKVIKESDKIEKLKIELNQAVLSENFEKAANLRDIIRSLEGKVV